MVHKVFETCYNREGLCIHWVIENPDAAPRLMSGRSIDGFNAHANNRLNPWTLISEEYAREIIKTEPKHVYPTHEHRPPTNIMCMTRDEARDRIEDAIGSDCWSVFLRDPNSHSVVKQIYFLPLDSDAEPEVEITESKKRAEIDYDDLVTALDKYELCTSFGYGKFMDDYYKKVGPDTYIHVRVDSWTDEEFRP